MPAWNHRHDEIAFLGVPIHLLFHLLFALALAGLAGLTILSGNGLMAATMFGLGGLLFAFTCNKILLKDKRSFAAVLSHNKKYQRLRYNDILYTQVPKYKDYELNKLPIRIHEGFVFNDDGSLSIGLKFQGWSIYLNSSCQQQLKHSLRAVLEKMPAQSCFEFHLCRHPSKKLSSLYEQYPLQRQKKFSQFIRSKMAQRIQQNEYRHLCFLIVTLRPKRQKWFGLGRVIREQVKLQTKLSSLARSLCEHLPKAEIDTHGTFRQILRLNHDARLPYDLKDDLSCRAWFCGGKIDLVNDLIRLPDGRYLKTLWFEDYPNASIGFVCRLSQPPITLHLVQALRPTSSYELQGVQREINISRSMAAGANLANARVKLQAHQGLQDHCAEHRNALYWNYYALQLIDRDPKRVKDIANALRQHMASINGTVRDYPDIQYAAWHYLLPGSSHLAQRWRMDETDQVIGMCPVHSPHTGASTPLSLRLSTQNTPVYIGYRRGDVAHHTTIAMTGAGKSLDRCARILETFGTGIDIYALEIGQSLWWAIEAVGGKYHLLDPDEVMINPLPDRACCQNKTLPIEILTTTTIAIAMLLTEDGRLNQFQMTSAQLAMKAVYANPESYPEPKLNDLHEQLLHLDHRQDEIKQAGQKMASYLGAFLESAEGQRLTGLPQLQMQAGAVGCDLSRIKEKTPRLLKFYLVFIALKFSQLAFSHNHPAEIILDEMHEFIRLAPTTIGALIEGIARMGRKNANYINLITQEISEIEAIGSSVLNQMLRKCVMYKQGDHRALAERLGMPMRSVERGKLGAIP